MQTCVSYRGQPVHGENGGEVPGELPHLVIQDLSSMQLWQAYDKLARAVKELNAAGWDVKGDAVFSPRPPTQDQQSPQQNPTVSPGNYPHPVPEHLPVISQPEPVAEDPGHGAQYTGSVCATCGSGMVVRAGACEVCRSCGSTTSCG